jgi:nucleotide-binding universal stress UspA family protein
MKNILVPVDFSVVTNKLLDEASILAETFHAKIYLMHVVPLESSIAVNDENSEEKKLNALAERLKSRGIDVTPLFIHGTVVDSILQESREKRADLILMGSHGHGKLYDLLMGSVIEGVLRNTSCPVTFFPSKASETQSA